MTAFVDYSRHTMPAGLFRDIVKLSDTSAIAKNSFQNRDMYLQMTNKLPRISASQQQQHRHEESTYQGQRRFSTQPSGKLNSMGGNQLLEPSSPIKTMSSVGGTRRKITSLTPNVGENQFQTNSYKPKTSNVSNRVNKINEEVLQDLSYLRQHAAKTGTKNRLGAFAKYEKYNPADILAKAQMEQESMQYALRRLICSEEQSQDVLYGGNQRIDVVRGHNMFYKINTANRCGPGILQISYAAGQSVKRGSAPSGRLVDLRVYYSANGIKEPTEQKNQKTYLDPAKSVALSFNPGRDRYEHEWIYVSFYSDSGCTIFCNIMWRDEKNQRRKVAGDREANNEVLTGEELALMDAPKKKQPQRPESPHIQRNIEYVANWNPVRQAEIQYQQRLVKDAIQKQVIDRKAAIAQEKAQLKKFELMRWALIKERKAKMLEAAIKRHRMSRLLTMMVKMISFTIVMKKVRQEFLTRKFAKHIEQQRNEFVWRLSKKKKVFDQQMRPQQYFAQFCKRFSESESKWSLHRLLKTQRQMRCSAIAISQFNSGEERASETMYLALALMRDQLQVIKSFKTFSQKLQLVQTMARKMLRLHRTRRGIYTEYVKQNTLKIVETEKTSKQQKQSMIAETLEGLLGQNEFTQTIGESIQILLFNCQAQNIIVRRLQDTSMTEEERKSFEVDLMKREIFYDQLAAELFEDKKVAADLKAKAQNPTIAPALVKFPSRSLFTTVIKKLIKDPVTTQANLKVLIKQRKDQRASRKQFTYKKNEPANEMPKPNPTEQ